MTKVYQTRFGMGDGNCFAACIASLLEVELKEVDFTATEDGWLPILNDLIRPYGYRWLEINLNTAVKYPIYSMYGQLCVFTGKSPRGECNHAVVGRLEGTWEDRQVTYVTVHDPMPNGTGIVDGMPFLLGFFLPILPHRNKLQNLDK